MKNVHITRDNIVWINQSFCCFRYKCPYCEFDDVITEPLVVPNSKECKICGKRYSITYDKGETNDN